MERQKQTSPHGIPIKGAHGVFAAKLFDLPRGVHGHVIVLAVEFGRAEIHHTQKQTAGRGGHVTLAIDSLIRKEDFNQKYRLKFWVTRSFCLLGSAHFARALHSLNHSLTRGTVND